MIFFSPDNVHINNKNFTSLIKYVSSGNNKFIQNNNYINLITCFGKYDNVNEIDEYKKEYKQYSKEMLFDASILGYNLFDVCRAELLTFLITKDDFFKFNMIWTRDKLFNFIYENFYNDLINNISSSAFWLIYWKEYLLMNKIDIALIFSGSLTYSKSLIKILQKTSIRTFVLERYFSGNDFYCEERFSHISNNSLIKFKSYYNSIKINEDEFNRDYMKAINKYLMSDNLNVKQPSAKNATLFNNKNKVVTIIGQVVNDFSIIEYNDVGFNSILVYEKIISDIIHKTDYNIIFKAHPWENRKANLHCSFTLNYLKSKFSLKERIIFLENYNINEIFEQSDEVIVLNSQSGIEAVWAGIKPIVLAEPFYGHKGFTVDMSLESIDEVCEYLSQRKTRSTLTIEEYKKFEIFLIKTFQYHLVSKFPSGVMTLRKIFEVEKTIALYHRNDNKQLENKSVKNKIIIEEKSINNLIKTDTSNQKNNYKKSSFFQKLKKLQRSPYTFFKDSNKFYVKIFARFFIKGE